MPSLHVLNPAGNYALPECALAVMAKAPVARLVKTRLCPPLTPEQAAALNRCFLQDISKSIVAAASTTGGCSISVYLPPGSEALFNEILPSQFCLLPQRGDTLEQRIIAAAEDLFSCGFRHLCLINSDSPTVPGAIFIEAINTLRQGEAEVVLGPARDGGYYLIGMRRLHRRLFEEIEWSTHRVFQQTLERAKELRLEVYQLPTFTDVDDVASLRLIYDEICACERDGKESPARQTKRFLNEIMSDAGL